jgi:FkbM family methyltransferase
MQFLRERLKAARKIARHPLNRDAPAQAVLRYLAWNIGRRLLVADYVLPLAGQARLILSNAENYATLAYTEQLWDFEEMAFLLHLLRPEDLFADIGANVGGYSVLAAAVAGAAAIAFEPVPETYAKLQRNLRLNGIEDRVEAIHCGLADQAGELRFTASRGGLNHVAVGEAADTVMVPVATLDTVLGARRPIMLKMDVEGYEMQVMRGGAACLGDAAVKAVILELNGSSERYGAGDAALHGQMLEFGFRPHAYEPAARRLTLLDTYRTDGLNTLYCRAADPLIAERIAAAPAFTVRGRTF